MDCVNLTSSTTIRVFFRVAGVFHAYAFWINSIVSYINKYALASQSGQACPNAYGTFI